MGEPQPAGTGHTVMWSAWACKPRVVIESGQESLTGVVKRGAQVALSLRFSVPSPAPGRPALCFPGIVWGLGSPPGTDRGGGCPGGWDPGEEGVGVSSPRPCRTLWWCPAEQSQQGRGPGEDSGGLWAGGPGLH